MEKMVNNWSIFQHSINNIIQKPEIIIKKFDKESTLTTANDDIFLIRFARIHTLRVYQSISNKKYFHYGFLTEYGNDRKPFAYCASKGSHQN